MPKVMIEIDLPEGQAIPDARDIVRLTDPDWLASWWSIDDVKEVLAEPLLRTTTDMKFFSAPFFLVSLQDF